MFVFREFLLNAFRFFLEACFWLAWLSLTRELLNSRRFAGPHQAQQMFELALAFARQQQYLSLPASVSGARFALSVFFSAFDSAFSVWICHSVRLLTLLVATVQTI